MRKEKRLDQKKMHEMTSQEIVAAMHRKLARNLQAQSLLGSIGDRRFNFETSAPGLPGYYLYMLY